MRANERARGIEEDRAIGRQVKPDTSARSDREQPDTPHLPNLA